ncbi:transcriptional regulator [Rhizobium sp. Leaf371]|uniref:IclR family transcriptional regulator n=1 Tax=Rhizobium sp. Leaf371 TaxID=1736355 RepID=UPI000714BE39|nr:IclR family transcriptional regulator [Rhizobium sp. Leaf371]KQS61249.1 transcriptional regulator [Rhizobium sp. Leaf371]
MDIAVDKDLTGSQSVDRALKLLSLVGRQGERGMALSEIVEQSGINKPTARRLLLALIRSGLVDQDADGRRYFIGQEAYILGMLASPRYGLLRMSMPSIHRIALKTCDSTFVSVRRDAVSVCLHREEGTFPIRTHALQTGYEHPLGAGAGSLAMLAALPDAEVESMMAKNAAVLEKDYPTLTPDELRRQVALARQLGYSVNPGLVLANSWGIGVAIRNPDGTVAGALSVAAIDSRMQPPRQKELGLLLKDEAAQIEAILADQFGRQTRLQPATHAKASTPKAMKRRSSP